MNKPMLLTVLLFVGITALSAESAAAFCLRDGRSSDLTEGDAFVSSSPASSDSNFRLEVGLDDLGSLAETLDRPEPESAEMTVDAADEGELEIAEDESETTVTVDGISSEEAIEAELPVHQREYESREDYLNAIAIELNDCRE
ncbi:MAG: hypothetical protein ACFB12_19455 [Leptolyngbyaceae cyanobacterium]